MGVMTISMRDDTERKFREAVKERLGEGKGKLGKAVEEAVEKWMEEKKTDEYVKEALALMEKGLYKLGKDYKFRREEAYDE